MVSSLRTGAVSHPEFEYDEGAHLRISRKPPLLGAYQTIGYHKRRPRDGGCSHHFPMTSESHANDNNPLDPKG